MNIRSISTKVLLTLILTIILTFSFFFYILMYSYRNEKLHKINQAGQEAMTRLLTTSSLLYSAESTESSINFAEHSFYNEMTINSSIQSITLYSIDNSLKLRFERNEQWLPIQVNTEPSFQYDAARYCPAVFMRCSFCSSSLVLSRRSAAGKAHWIPAWSGSMF